MGERDEESMEYVVEKCSYMEKSGADWKKWVREGVRYREKMQEIKWTRKRERRIETEKEKYEESW